MSSSSFVVQIVTLSETIPLEVRAGSIIKIVDYLPKDCINDLRELAEQPKPQVQTNKQTSY